jgi:hypothetical protein
MSPEHPHHAEEKGYVRVAALMIVLVLVTVLLYQVIDDVQRHAAQRRRELRRQQWREQREREYQQLLLDIAATQPTQPAPSPPDSAATDHPAPAPRSE